VHYRETKETKEEMKKILLFLTLLIAVLARLGIISYSAHNRRFIATGERRVPERGEWYFNKTYNEPLRANRHNEPNFYIGDEEILRKVKRLE
jgi:hypothetical protein